MTDQQPSPGPQRSTRLVAVVGGLTLAAVIAVVVMISSGGDADPDRQLIEGFGEVGLRITEASGEVADWCAMLAADDERRQQGLMNQTDLGGYDGMLFQFDAPEAGGFWMKNTLMPLSIAYFDQGGALVSTADMEPCPAGAADCPSYEAEAPYVWALEVPQGDLDDLGVAPGAQLATVGSCR